MVTWIFYLQATPGRALYRVLIAITTMGRLRMLARTLQMSVSDQRRGEIMTTTVI